MILCKVEFFFKIKLVFSWFFNDTVSGHFIKLDGQSLRTSIFLSSALLPHCRLWTLVGKKIIKCHLSEQKAKIEPPKEGC